MIILIKLILAHLLGDFLFQPHQWVLEKAEKKLGSVKLYMHALIHGVLVMLIIWDINFWRPALIIMLSHGAIDGLKSIIQNEKNKRHLFFIDQVLHLGVIFIMWYFWQNISIPFESIFTEKRLLFLTGIITITTLASVAIKVLISRWATETGDEDEASLQSAGKYIGILERLFVLVFVLTGHWEAVGFLIAAKSVFRFGDLKESKDRKLTE